MSFSGHALPGHAVSNICLQLGMGTGCWRTVDVWQHAVHVCGVHAEEMRLHCAYWFVGVCTKVCTDVFVGVCTKVCTSVC